LIVSAGHVHDAPHMRSLYVCLGLSVSLAACATANHDKSGSDGGGDDMQPIDASLPHDSGNSGGQDSENIQLDSSTGCTTMTSNLLANANLDGTPMGTGWAEMPIDASNPLINAASADGGLDAQSGAYRAWLGGYERAASSNIDVLSQDVQIPAMTTSLQLTGYYDLRTAEYVAGTYDFAKIQLTTTTGSALETMVSLDDDGATTAWTPFQATIAGNYSGMTVRLKLTSAGDSTDPTSFFFDTLALTATYCQ
jgi:hypothetical protein